MAAELSTLGVVGSVTEGGVSFKATPEDLARVLTWSRIAGGVRVRLGRVKAHTLEDLAHGVRLLPWKKYAFPHQPVQVDVSSRGSRLRRGGAVERKVEHAIRDALRGPRLSMGRPPREPVGVHLRIVDDRAEISVEAAGERMHRRGWRLDTGKAPLRENLAAAVLHLAKWRPEEPLVDPMCGSGTFLIEASRMASGTAPRTGWTYASERWPSADPQAMKAAAARRSAPQPTRLFGSDRMEGAIATSQENARRAKVQDVQWTVCHFGDREPPAPTGLLVANPPYGQRVDGQREPRRIYEAFGHGLRARWSGWRVAFLAPDPALVPLVHGGAKIVARFSNGGIPVCVALVQL